MIHEKYNDILNINNLKTILSDANRITIWSINISIHYNYKFRKSNILAKEGINSNLTFSIDYNTNWYKIKCLIKKFQNNDSNNFSSSILFKY